MRKRLFVHVGYPKTGTSTIQRAFDAERGFLLASHGLLYPESCLARPEFGHHNIYWEATGDPLFNPSNGRLEDLLSEVRRMDPEQVLVSSESLVTLLVEDPGYFRHAFAESLAAFDLTVVIAVRRLDEHVEASFRQQFNAWLWGRAIKRNTDLDEYLAKFDVDRALLPLRILREAGYDLIHLAYGDGMVERFTQALDLGPGVSRRLARHGDVNVNWMSARAMTLIHHLTQRPDEPELRRQVAADRATFQQLLETLGPVDRTRLISAERARDLLARAEPVYRGIDPEFARAVVGENATADWVPGTLQTQFSREEIARVDAFFGMPVMSDTVD